MNGRYEPVTVPDNDRVPVNDPFYLPFRPLPHKGRGTLDLPGRDRVGPRPNNYLVAYFHLVAKLLVHDFVPPTKTNARASKASTRIDLDALRPRLEKAEGRKRKHKGAAHQSDATKKVSHRTKNAAKKCRHKTPKLVHNAQRAC